MLMWGEIKTGYKSHWDSKKEYEKFWAQSKKNSQYHKNFRQKRSRPILKVLLCATVVAAFLILFQKGLSEYWLSKDSAGISASIVDSSPEKIPGYTGDYVIILNGGKPCFVDEDLISINGEYYSKLDSLGRCGTAMALLDRTMMPTDQRESIGKVKPTGWVQEKYPGIVDSYPPYLWNRCHLIAYSMTGQNANERNLITGTRYMNAITMLSYEEQVLQYLDNSDNHILYRVSPYFKGNELVARGVEIEAYSVEDNGDGICFHVFVYNVQPGIEIDYTTGISKKTN